MRLAERIRTLARSNSPIVFVPYEQAHEQGFEDMPRRVPEISKIDGVIGFKPKVQLDAIVESVIQHFRERQRPTGRPHTVAEFAPFH